MSSNSCVETIFDDLQLMRAQAHGNLEGESLRCRCRHRLLMSPTEVIEVPPMKFTHVVTFRQQYSLLRLLRFLSRRPITKGLSSDTLNGR